MSAPIERLADDIHDVVSGLTPLESSLLGDHRFDARVPDVTPGGRDAARRRLERLRARLDAVAANVQHDDAEPTDDVEPTDDALTLDVARHAIDQALHELDDRYVCSAAGPMTSGAGIGSPASAVLAALPKLTPADGAQAADLLARYRAIPGWLVAAEAQLRTGVATGYAPPARLIAATVRQIDRYLETSGDDDPLVVPAPAGHADPASWRAELGDVVATDVRPSLRRHRTVLTDEIAPFARSDTHVGLVHLPDGAALYRDAVAVHTTTGDDAEHYHRLGLTLIERLADEYRELGGAVLGTTDLDAIFSRLREDPALRFATSAEIHATAAASLARADAAMGDWFGPVGSIPCEVRPIPPHEAPESTIAYYQPPAIDGTRPGIYYVNTTQPTRRPRFEAEALAFHESVPGHHTQIATAMELDLPTLRRMRYLTAYAEGWGLYVERLADEMGLYTGSLDRLGMLSFDSWRACRLVVDTGMHADGWSRDRAVAFMTEHSPQARDNISNEVDRYIGWPGQALAYMAGRQRLVALRDHARQLLGSRFDIAGFHGAVLDRGPVPLDTLDQLVEAWARDQLGAASS